MGTRHGKRPLRFTKELRLSKQLRPYFYYRVPEVAELLKMPRSAVYQALLSGALPGTRHGKLWLIERSEMDPIIRSFRAATKRPPRTLTDANAETVA